MIKFNCIIHKETGTVIKYEDWLKWFENNESRVFFNKEKTEKQLYSKSIAFDKFEPKEMLFSDDFEIIYNSEFTTDELEQIAYTIEIADIRAKAKELIGEREYYNKYGIDI